MKTNLKVWYVSARNLTNNEPALKASMLPRDKIQYFIEIIIRRVILPRYLFFPVLMAQNHSHINKSKLFLMNAKSYFALYLFPFTTIKNNTMLTCFDKHHSIFEN